MYKIVGDIDTIKNYIRITADLTQFSSLNFINLMGWTTKKFAEERSSFRVLWKESRYNLRFRVRGFVEEWSYRYY